LDSTSLDKGAAPAGKRLKDLEEQGAKTEASFGKLGKTGVSSMGGLSDSSKKLGEAGSKAGKAFGELGAAVGSFLALIGGTLAIKEFILDTIASSAALERFSKNIGASTGAVAAWGNMAAEIGGKAGDVQSAFAMLAKTKHDLLMTGDSSELNFLNIIGMNPAELAGADNGLMKMAEHLKQYQALHGRSEAFEQATNEGHLSDTMANLILDQSTESLKANLAAQKALADEQDRFAKASAPLQKSIADIKLKFVELGLVIFEKIEPALEKFLGWMTSITNWAEQHKDAVAAFAIAAAVGLLALSGAIGAVSVALGIATLAAAAFDLATAPLTIPILAAVAAITAMGVALGVLTGDYKAWKEGSGGSFFDWSAIEPGVQAFKKAFADLEAIAKDAMGAIYYEMTAVWRASHGDFKGAKQAMDQSDEYVRGLASHAVHDGDKEADVATKTRANLAANGGKPTDNFEDAPNAPGAAITVGSMSLPDAIAHVEGFDPTGKSKNRPTRDNNPGDIRAFSVMV